MIKIVSIKENHLFSKVYAKGKNCAGKNLVVYALPNFKKPGKTMLGITASKKLGGAVQRSRARRIIREAYRRAAGEKDFSRPYLIVVVARRPLFEKGRKMQDLIPELRFAFNRLGLYGEEK